jgi:transcription antitermination factor NusG
MDDNHFPWFALRVRTAAEPLACKQIEGLGLAPFLPSYTTRKRWSDRMKTVQTPLFPGYVFCRFDPNDRLPVLKCSAVVDVVRSGRTPLPVETREIESIRRAVQSLQTVGPYPYLANGQTVELDRGPLKGLSGIVIENGSQLVLSISLLQRSMVVKIEESWIAPGSSQSSGISPMR